MANEYQRMSMEDAKQLEKVFKGAISLSIVDGDLKDVHIKLPDGGFITISKSAQYSDNLSILKLIKPKVYLARFSIKLKDDTIEMLKQFETEEARDFFVDNSLDYDTRKTLQLEEKEIG